MTTEQLAKLTPAQREGLARADAKIEPAMKLYEERNKLLHLVYRIPMRDLERLNNLLAQATPEEIKSAATFLEGLVEWRSPTA